MSFVSTLRQWDEAVAFADQGDRASALKVLLSIEEKTSKIAYNIGSLHLMNNDLDSAEKAFDNSIGKDEHLAVAFFQRGIVFYKKEKFEESLMDFENAFKELRGNHLIDYKPLGLRYKLYACEVLHNIGLVHAQLKQWEEAQEKLLTALTLKSEAKFSHIDHALEAILKQKLFALVELRAGLLFKPNKKYVAELEKKDYLGKAKVVASVVPEDEFSGFAPLQPQIEDVPSTPKAPEVLRVLEGVPHTVLYEFEPKTSDELAVLPGNIVFVLRRGADNWASVIFNGRRGLVPYNYLEPLDITVAPKQEELRVQPSGSDKIPDPPRREAPNLPVRKEGWSPAQDNSAPETQTDKKGDFHGCVVKVHFHYTIAICVTPGVPYGTIVQKISNKLKLPATAISLRHAKPGSNEKVAFGESEMADVWSSVQNGRLTLWCSAAEGKETEALCVNKVMALYDYEASTPEDLDFHQGDIVTVLSKVNEDWLEGHCNGKTGIFPKSFVQEQVKSQ
ncbi:neutrophil cytosol factor 2 [Chanos chanos]|uniref:Neutrophil cytosol factor 2 n=1 Tax=Chanos chanos TaxID=29144 RepID=A0A6J2VWE3_CHACN|nr:neutrophil cytosol factor 2 [Chanos chanos]